MSDFEQSILKRAAELQAQRENEARELQARQLDHDARRAEVERQSLRLGIEVVQLLQKYNVPSHDIWESRPTGKIKARHGYSLSGSPRGTTEVTNYFYSGQGWEVYSVLSGGGWSDEPIGTSWAGIADSGRIILSPRLGTGKKLSGEEVNGILNPNYEEAEDSIRHFQRDTFQNGIAFLISGRSK